jgi:hypothetical protein
MAPENRKNTGLEVHLVENIIRATVNTGKSVGVQIEDLLPLLKRLDQDSEKAAALRFALKQFYVAQEALGLAQTTLRRTLKD